MGPASSAPMSSKRSSAAARAARRIARSRALREAAERLAVVELEDGSRQVGAESPQDPELLAARLLTAASGNST